jgi:hypothetical protein
VKINANLNETSPTSQSFTALILHYQNELPVVGLEYIVEFLDGVKCFLCEKTFNERPPLLHITSTIHQENYLQFHFPSIHKFITELEQRIPKLSKVNFISQSHFKSWLVNEVSDLIHKYCGVLKPTFVRQKIESVKHEDIFKSVEATKHFTEKDPEAKGVLEAITESCITTMMTQNIVKILKTKHETSSNSTSVNSSTSVDFSIDVDFTECDFTDENNNEDIELLTSDDYQALFENFDSLESYEQQRLCAHIQSISPKKVFTLRGSLSVKAEKYLTQALKQS